MRLRVALSAAALAAGACLPLAGMSHAQDLDCANFSTQEQAQAVFNADPFDSDNLDADNDGIACEVLPRATTGAVTTAPAADGSSAVSAPASAPAAAVQVPVGGVPAGTGPARDGTRLLVAAGLAGGAVLVAVGAGIARRRLGGRSN
ncbi:excalibur calcium-binding domain-containing protein [Kitasatospora sp. NPDC051914]|uniref:excalibur calcium-binding domain-containing protein n=1 Tax=Kitasatospora sp. NPDC051914 TaxID=3154945 RepID=UPI003418C520